MTQSLCKNSPSFWQKLLLTLNMIKFQHSVFALPFALASCVVAAWGLPPPLTLLMIVLAMVTARNAAMSYNRMADLEFDRKNPRTAGRELPQGKISVRFTFWFCLINAGLFIIISRYFNDLTFYLSPLALAIILGYSLTKRFTSYTQIFLGLSLGIAPIAAWIAITGTIAPFPCLLGLFVLFWVAGFDIIYSTMDYEYDKGAGLKNLTVRWGIRNSLRLARFFHGVAISFLVVAGVVQGLSWIFFLGVAVIVAILIYEHSLVRPHDLTKVNMAFFTLNGYVSLVFFFFVCLEIFS